MHPLTDNPLWCDQIRPDSEILKFDLDQRRLAQFVQRKLSKALHSAEEQHLWRRSSSQGVADQTLSLQQYFALLLSKCPGAGNAHHLPGKRERDSQLVEQLISCAVVTSNLLGVLFQISSSPKTGEFHSFQKK